MASQLTARGAATRSRIVESAAEQVLAGGVGGTSLDEIRAGSETSKSQLFHYFPGGKSELVGAIASFQADRVLAAQEPCLSRLATWEDWQGWRDAVVNHYGSQPHWGCPIGALANELISTDRERAAEVATHMEHWRRLLEAGVVRLRDAEEIGADADPRALSLAVFAALQGGLLLTATAESIEPLEAALDGALAMLRAA
ncbi:MAG TPA: TetR family transcriptional regulator C-terminal domain-containing protein [Solirubrobacterales bacterium]|jgi:AcrR family transcriptional regulator|nr:TetR family transcriptional regulator C-terminal domain-containing protein [Solirubrobacterales bacterium]